MIQGHSPTKQASLLILGARRAQITAIRTALDMGLRVIAIDPDPAAPGLALATFSQVHDLADLDAILAVARAQRIAGIMTLAADYPMPTVAAVCAELNLPGPSLEVVAKATNKRLMRLALSNENVPCPRFIHVETIEQARQAVASLGGDVIFKPAMSHGGRGITRVSDGSPDAVIELAFQRALRETRSDGVMVEEFIDGPEFSIESLTHQGVTRVVAVTDKLTSGAPYFVELGHNQPSRWPADQIEALRHTAEQAVAALGIDEAAGHTEIRLASSGPVIMEVAARLGGGFINSHLVPLSTGIDLVAATIQVAIGEAPDLQPRTRGRAAAIRFLCASPGRVTRIEGLETVRQIEGVEEVEVYVQPHDRIAPLVDASGRCGHVICSAADPGHVIALAERALHGIHIHTVTEPSA
jgi:biotin carboxylase